MTTVLAQKCSKCGLEYPPKKMVCGCERCGGRIEILYDYEKIRQKLTRKKSVPERANLWQYSELLPILDETKRISLGEGGTSLMFCKRLAVRLGLRRLYVKDETRNPEKPSIPFWSCVEVR